MTQLDKIKDCIDEFINSNPQSNLDSEAARFKLSEIIENCLKSDEIDNVTDESDECCGGGCHSN